MTEIAAPWRSPSSEGRTVQVVQVPRDVLECLVGGDLAGANLGVCRRRGFAWAAAAGLVRAPELETKDDDGPVVIYASARTSRA